jgi:hypothetical protein
VAGPSRFVAVSPTVDARDGKKGRKGRFVAELQQLLASMASQECRARSCTYVATMSASNGWRGPSAARRRGSSISDGVEMGGGRDRREERGEEVVM